MLSHLSESKHAGVPSPVPVEPGIVREQMERIVLSSHFRQSRRYPLLLRYVVERTLDGLAESLKERTLGIEVFHRNADYDTNIDPVVRIAAGEVRKRIAQYYHEEGHADELRIDLPPGSYVPQFRLNSEQRGMHSASRADHRLEEPPAATATAQAASAAMFEIPVTSELGPVQGTTWTWKIPAALIGCLLLAGSVWWGLRRGPTGIEAVWLPMLASNAPLVISAGEPSLISGVRPEDRSELTVREHLLGRDQMVFSDVNAIAAIASFANARHHAYKLQIASTTTFADLRSAPTVLLGGYDNPWTMRSLEPLRFRLRRDPDHDVDWIEDRRNPTDQSWRLNLNGLYSKLSSDYAIVARFTDENTHQPVMIAAGIGENGTKAAAEFLTDPAVFQLLTDAGKTASPEANFEIVLEAIVVDGVSGPPRILAKEVW